MLLTRMDLRKHLYSPSSYCIIDLLIINLSLIVALYLRFDSLDRFFHEKAYQLVIAFANISWISFALYIKPHSYIKSVRFISNVSRYGGAIFLHFFMLTFLIFIINLDDVSRGFLIRYLIITSLLTFIIQLSLNLKVRSLKSKRFNLKKLILIGEGTISDDIKNLITQNPEYGYELDAIFSNRESFSKGLLPFSQLSDYVQNHSIAEIYCCIPYVDYDKIHKVITLADATFSKVKLVTDYRGFGYKKLGFEQYGDIPLISISNTPLESKVASLSKRIFDLLFSSCVILLIMSWLHPLLAILIKFDSKGPVLFKQNRHGKNDHLFGCYKFRSMKVNKESDTKEAKQGDNRITKLGSILRKSSLDEMPQFYNVFLGHMSMVGPRPCPISFYKDYSKRVEKFSFRHFVKPGITGLAQAKGYRGSTDEAHSLEGRFKLDRFYVENWSLTLDIKIIYLTILSLFKKDNNAY